MVRGSDLRAARLLCGLTCDELARQAELHPCTVRRIEGGHTQDQGTVALLILQLGALGALVIEPGLVRHLDGRTAPTREVVGVFHGVRLARARRMLRLSREQVASASGVSVETLKRMEGRKNLRQTLSLYQVVGALQRAGYYFGPRRTARNSDRVLIRQERPELDLPVTMLRHRPRLHHLRRDTAKELDRLAN